MAGARCCMKQAARLVYSRSFFMSGYLRTTKESPCYNPCC
jgi:hypothetical protein